MEKYHVFYIWAYGVESRHEEFTDEDAMLELVKRASEPGSPYRHLTVIYGEKLEFEPYEKVIAWRIKNKNGG